MNKYWYNICIIIIKIKMIILIYTMNKKFYYYGYILTFWFIIFKSFVKGNQILNISLDNSYLFIYIIDILCFYRTIFTNIKIFIYQMKFFLEIILGIFIFIKLLISYKSSDFSKIKIKTVINIIFCYTNLFVIFFNSKFVKHLIL